MLDKKILDKLDALVESLTLDELCGQVINYNVAPSWSEEYLEEVAKRTFPGAIFLGEGSKQRFQKCAEIVNRYTKVPVIVSADIENGPGCALEEEAMLPNPMAWGACDDEELIYEAGAATGEICRKNGIHWSFAPIVDINYNKDNPVVNIRAISDEPQRVAKIAEAYAAGLQHNGMMVAGCKHFPGDGVDDRNQHFCTTVNSLSKEEWMNSFGYVYKKMFSAGVASVMVAHIALPAFQEDEFDEVMGYYPATLSKRLMTDLLKGELGFDGCVVSDALSMIGACAMVKPDKLVVEFLKAGGDMALFALPEDFDRVKQAVLAGELSMERLKDAVKRVLVMKYRARLFENQQEIEESIILSRNIEEISDKIGEKSIKIIRNTQNLLPLKLREHAKILLCNLQGEDERMVPLRHLHYLEVLEKELQQRGYITETLVNTTHYEIKKRKDDYDCILINCKLSSRDYPGGTLRANWEHMHMFWRGYVLDHPCVIFTSFGDPFKLYEYPFMKTYINAHCYCDSVQKGFVKVLLGEVEETAVSPVSLPFAAAKDGVCMR